ncbi:MAG: small ribosomal subunit Rsm22 family protein [Desulfovibrionaceae bacterium]
MTTEQRLLRPIAPEAARLLDGLRQRLKAVMPLRPKHLAGLPRQLCDLSRALTAERGRLPKDYMTAPATLSAYLHYFLPWSVYRLSRLLPSLDLGLAPGSRILDVGAGPLALTQALWISRPDLRGLDLQWLCRDKSLKALRTGRDLLDRMIPKDSPWKVRIEQGVFGSEPKGQADLAAAVNLVNELFLASKSGEQDTAVRAAEHLAELPAESGRLLLVEPGTRTAARQLVLVREELMEAGLHPLAPCPHPGECPMPGRRNTPWCHFGMDVLGAPRWLSDLATRAKLQKSSTSLSFLLMGPEPAQGPEMIRVVSDPFPLPGGRSGQYGCSPRGLALLTRPQGALARRPGDALPAKWSEEEQRDPKSRALMVEDRP